MRCKICKKKTNWDESYGLTEFIVCPYCFQDMVAETKKRHKKMNEDEAYNHVFSSILLIGKQAQKKK